ncbi:MAG: dephospho-CoA kinase [Bacteroidota bacterium]|nr:dephospho-CoA kinase [Bacteroidota bacterium]MDP4218586.1 dephospho-CoA kinase [Bacteroidota bacterium]
MLRVGLTGGIGSGKTTVAGIFQVLGVPVSYADEDAKALMNEDAEVKEQIIRHFGPEAYVKGQLNRSWLSGQVFADPQKLALLNSIVHPATLRAAEQWMQRQATAGAPYAIKEAALIFESRAGQMLDLVIGVDAPVAVRIHRTIKRDGIAREEVLKRMRNQIDADLKMKLCDYVIRNDGQEAVLPQVLALHEKLLLRARGV